MPHLNGIYYKMGSYMKQFPREFLFYFPFVIFYIRYPFFKWHSFFLAILVS